MTRYLVTGGGGFLGRHVVEQLKDQPDAEIIVPRRSAHDLTRQDDVERLMAAEGPDVIIHLAAEVGGIGANQVNPGRYFYANAIMGIHLIEAARANAVSKFVQVGTVCSYPKHTPVPFSEENMWEGFPEETNAPYGIAKRSLLLMLQAYRSQYGLNGIYLLPANLYGPHDNFDLETSHVIPALIRKFTSAKHDVKPTVTLWGTGSATREFVHVHDAARGIVAASHEYDSSAPMNLGTGEETRIRDLAQKISDMVGYEGDISWDASRPDGQPRRSLDVSRAKAEIDFTAQISLEDGLRETIDWWEQESQTR